MQKMIFKDAQIINRGQRLAGDVLIAGGRLERVGGTISAPGAREINAQGRLLLPGLIDDQVHFREPGLTHKGSIASEARAAVAGGVTSYMEMPNTKPPALTQALLAEKYAQAAATSLANYSFFMGAGNDNLEEVLRTDPQSVCGVKIFMGSSTGNLLVDNPQTLEALFSQVPVLIATHCEDEATVRQNEQAYLASYGEDIPFHHHPDIRSVEACLLSSTFAVDLARRHGTRLHVLHLTTAEELALFSNDQPLASKRITAEVCVHHLHFSSDDYARLGSQIKCNPAIKAPRHRAALWAALLDDRLDVIATDHAPHTWAEKQGTYFHAPSGLPLVQHSLHLMLAAVEAGQLTLERLVEKMCHAPAICFRLVDRGFLDEGAWADVVMVDPAARTPVDAAHLHYHCGWSPLAGMELPGRVEATVVSGHLAYYQGQFFAEQKGARLAFAGLA